MSQSQANPVQSSASRCPSCTATADFACNWIGGEAVSLAIPWAHRTDFAAAGYEPLRTNGTYAGGQTRREVGFF
ncbi:Carboxypeptidase S1-like protein B [Colletotrichum orbiculare MAFF 240422]|uniref:Carboxypeptidase S1-like protein B n=1 Tax=Colletotrichum orbiculare (strain 104-T / ATCC 96160 / CBS 514.97 / LARS 414 / MAFF 240422) TaxID=1213857 RepID=A0A484FI94_COLOR|nr:Carboxypeptidase S1-like protein B [Colletotrichum orbiculare MAFF 240422]